MSNKFRLFEIMERVNPDFKRLDEKNPNEYNGDSLMNDLSNIADDIHQPKPTNILDTGSNAMVFNTTNPNILIRAELIEDGEYSEDLKEYILSDPDIQETGGVSKIYNIGEYELNNEQYLVTWKEKVDPNFNHIIYSNYDEVQATEILRALNLYNIFYNTSREQRDQQLRILKSTKETNKLYQAIMAGLPLDDLSNDSNMGINSTGDIVAYDV